MIETGQKYFVLHKYEDFVPIVEGVASCDCIVEKLDYVAEKNDVGKTNQYRQFYIKIYFWVV